MSQVSDLIPLLALAAAVGAWLGFSRARERATDEVRHACQRHGLQLLDETVALRGVRLRREHGRLGWQRTYAFDVSTSGDDRLSGRVTLAGDRVIHLDLPAAPQASRADTPAAGMEHADGGNVVPFPRRSQRTLH